MNPSANGWIKKYGQLLKSTENVCEDFNQLYNKYKLNGFIYGFNQDLDSSHLSSLVYSTDEIAKINLFTALYYTYLIRYPKSNTKEFINELYNFYGNLEVSKPSFLIRLIRGGQKDLKLEGVINDRVLIDRNIFTRHFNHSITNALLFIDVLTFKSYLKSKMEVREYAQNLETAILQITMDANYISEGKSNNYSHLFKDSYFYTKSRKKSLTNVNHANVFSNFKKYEKQYLLDLACAICYSDFKYSEHDIKYIKQLGARFNFDKKNVDKSIESVKNFYRKKVYFNRQLKDNHPISNFFDNSSKIVSKLVRRNLNRISQEVTESKELMYLLNQSRKRNLTKAEHHKIQEQLLDIFKTIPSLAIFVLPGGMLLLPIVAKILPNMLPSSFYENKIEKTEK